VLGAKMVPETSVIFNQLIRLIARADLIKAGVLTIQLDVRLIPTSKRLEKMNSNRLTPRTTSVFWVSNKEQLIISSIKPVEISTEIKIT
jgi:hypothetical protein